MERGPTAVVYEYVTCLAPLTPDGDESDHHGDHVRCAQARLLDHLSKRFASEYGISRALALQRALLSGSTLGCDERERCAGDGEPTSHTLSVNAALVNDSLDAPAELGRGACSTFFTLRGSCAQEAL